MPHKVVQYTNNKTVKGDAFRRRKEMETPFLTNQRLDEKQTKAIVELSTPEEPVLFAVVGNISPRAQYGTNVLLATRAHLFTYDFQTEECSEKIAFSDVEKIYNKRMYGNGLMRAKMKDGSTREILPAVPRRGISASRGV